MNCKTKIHHPKQASNTGILTTLKSKFRQWLNCQLNRMPYLFNTPQEPIIIKGQLYKCNLNVPIKFTPIIPPVMNTPQTTERKYHFIKFATFFNEKMEKIALNKLRKKGRKIRKMNNKTIRKRALNVNQAVILFEHKWLATKTSEQDNLNETNYESECDASAMDGLDDFINKVSTDQKLQESNQQQLSHCTQSNSLIVPPNNIIQLNDSIKYNVDQQFQLQDINKQQQGQIDEYTEFGQPPDLFMSFQQQQLQYDRQHQVISNQQQLPVDQLQMQLFQNEIAQSPEKSTAVNPFLQAAPKLLDYQIQNFFSQEKQQGFSMQTMSTPHSAMKDELFKPNPNNNLFQLQAQTSPFILDSQCMQQPQYGLYQQQQIPTYQDQSMYHNYYQGNHYGMNTINNDIAYAQAQIPCTGEMQQFIQYPSYYQPPQLDISNGYYSSQQQSDQCYNGLNHKPQSANCSFTSSKSKRKQRINS